MILIDTETIMDWNAEDDDRQALTRIAEMLVALAVLAECACGRSRPVRCLVLWILRPAEVCARNFVVGEALASGGAMADLPAPMSAGNGVAGLMRLAVCFRMLARAIRKLPGHCFARRSTARSASLRHLARLVPATSSGPADAAPRPADTS